MSGFLGELGKKLAERWLTLLVLPGVLYLAVAGTAVTLGHRHALDVRRLVSEITGYAADPAVATAGGQVALLAAALGGAAACGLLAQALGSLTERLVLAAGWQAWPAPVRGIAGRRVLARQRRWHEHNDTVLALRRRAMSPDPTERPDPAVRQRAVLARARVSVEPPERPTWSGDRIQAAAVRLDRDHHLDLFVVWPLLWLVLPDTVRTEITTARTNLSSATILAGWTLMYSPLVWWWWPAALVAAVLALTARHRVRATVDTYAGLVEAAGRIHATTLAEELGIDHTGPLSPDLGEALYRHLRSTGDG